MLPRVYINFVCYEPVFFFCLIAIIVLTENHLCCVKVTVNFQQSLEQGSKACITEAYQTAVGHYRTALTLLSKHSDLQVLPVCSELTTLISYQFYAVS